MVSYTYESITSFFHKIAPLTLRVGMSLVFFLFAYFQLRDPTNFIGYIPEFIYMANIHNIDFLLTLIKINAILEIILGTFLLLGLFTRTVSFLLFIHILLITLSLGFTLDGVRDLGLTFAMLAIFLNRRDAFSLDTYWRKKRKK